MSNPLSQDHKAVEESSPKESDSPRRKVNDYLPLVALLLVALIAVAEGLRFLLYIPVQAQADMAGWYLLGLGIIIFGSAAYAERPSRVAKVRGSVVNDEDETGDVEVITPANPVRDVSLCIALVVLYAAALPFAGFAITNGLTVFAFLRFISRFGWIGSILGAAVIGATFVLAFSAIGVVLPSGPFGF
ncbi:hypothetical protein [Nocardiopsis coralliicola]